MNKILILFHTAIVEFFTSLLYYKNIMFFHSDWSFSQTHFVSMIIVYDYHNINTSSTDYIIIYYNHIIIVVAYRYTA